MNYAAITQVFEAIEETMALPLKAIENFRNFATNLKHPAITTNYHYLNILHLIHTAFEVLTRRNRELSKGAMIMKWKWHKHYLASFVLIL